MKSCKYAMLAQRHADGELRAGEHEIIEAHLPSCGECRSRFDEILAFNAVFGRKKAAAPQRDLASAILNKLEVWNTGRQKDYFWETLGAMSRMFIPAAALVCVMMVILLLVTINAQNRTRTVPPENYYMSAHLKNHEQVFLAGKDEHETGGFYTVLVENTDYDTSGQTRK